MLIRRKTRQILATSRKSYETAALEFAMGASIIAHMVLFCALYLAGRGSAGVPGMASSGETPMLELILLPEEAPSQSLPEEIAAGAKIGAVPQILREARSVGSQSQLTFAATPLQTSESLPILETPTALTEAPATIDAVFPAFPETEKETASAKLEVNPVTRRDPAPGKLSTDVALPGGTPFNEGSSDIVRAVPAGIGEQGFSLHACYLMTPRPNYPKAARKRKQEGLVLVAVLVSADGQPTEIQVDQGSGFDLLDQAAIQAVKGWLFTPARKGDKPVACRVQVPIVFKLATSRIEDPNHAVAWSGKS